MSAVLRSRPRMIVAEFVEMIRPYPDEERWELLDGEAVLMAPQSERHQGIVANLLDCVRPRARKNNCRALPGLGLINDEIGDYAPIPDVVVRCGPMLDGGYAKDAVFLAEVLSPSTMNNDRGRKLDFYRKLSTLRTILVIYQDEVRVEAWQRDGDEWRREVRQGRGASLDLPELGGTLALADIYEGIPLDDRATATPSAGPREDLTGAET